VWEELRIEGRTFVTMREIFSGQGGWVGGQESHSRINIGQEALGDPREA